MNMNKPCCGCCAGKPPVALIDNRPGLAGLRYRIGDYASFLDTMLARLSGLRLGDAQDLGAYPLQKLSARSPDDFAIALLHAWATVADVLTFYQERLANEGYLRTATERRSVLELARLIGYQPRPGVSAGVFLAYTLDDNFKEPVLIGKGTRAQSIPGPGELPQAFETSEDLPARAAWNTLKPRLTRPQTWFSMLMDSKGPRVYLQGINTKLNADDPLLIDFLGNDSPYLFRVKDIIPNAAENRTLVMLQSRTEAIELSEDNWFEILQDEYSLILLDSGDGLPGFFNRGFDTVSGQNEFPLYAIADGSLSVLTVVEHSVIKLSRNATERFYAVKAAASVDNGSMTYVRLALQSLEDYAVTLAAISRPPSLPPRSEAGLARGLAMQFFGMTEAVDAPVFNLTDGSPFASAVLNHSSASITKGLNAVAEASNAIAKRFTPSLHEHLATATANAEATESNPIKVYALRAKAAPFGYNAPLRQARFNETRKIYINDEWQINDPFNEKASSTDSQPTITAKDFHKPRELYLDAEYPLLPGGWVVIDNPALSPQPVRLNNDNIHHGALAAYGISGKTTRLSLDNDWFSANPSFAVVRNTRVYLQSEALELAEEPLVAPVCGGAEDLIELDGYYENLQAGRWVMVSGERADVPGTSGLSFSELAMLAVVQQDLYRQTLSIGEQKTQRTLPGDKIHSFIKLAKPLAYCFKRDTVKIYANVVKATHGETRRETLGSGNGAKSFEAFTLKQPPLTFVAAANPKGVDSSLKVTVNGVAWHESASLNTLTPADRGFITRTDDDGRTTVIFGDGRQGARLPTGVENISAEYRSGIGKAGNVKAGQISLLVSRPPGVKAVINPLRASGGADRESRDQARSNAPLAVTALDRLVSVQDYEDFSRTYAGIGKACAAQVSDGSRRLVHVTIAGIDDAPIDDSSDLFINLRRALQVFGDPFQPLQLAVRELLLLVISAKVKIDADYQWELVAAALRAALLDAFSFERRELGQDVALSEVISVMQAVAGVAYIDIEAFGGLPEKEPALDQRQRLTPGQIAEKARVIAEQKTPAKHLQVNLAQLENGVIRPAQIAFLTPDVPESLILNQLL